MLQGIEKLHVPKTVKIQPRSPFDIYAMIKKEGFSYPIIFRQAGDHGGVSTIKVDNETEQFYAFALDGRDYYLTQYVDCSQDSIYSKYRLVVVDGDVFIRHAIFSDNWIIHSESRQYMKKNTKCQTQEKDILKSFDSAIKPKIKDVIQEIYNRLQLDYFGIDCNIDKDMNILVFEINANMNVLINNSREENNPWTKQMDQIKQAIIKMIMKDKK
jgi:glutathione synthase/RimK-type ligase-like ATP-grasp enzyme